MHLGLDGNTVLITGASKGIGRATAAAFAREGVAHLHLTARNAAELAAAREELQAAHGVTVSLHPMDLAARGAAARLADAVGEIDVLVNNAGAIPAGSIEDVDEDAWRTGWDLKVFGYIDLTRAIWRGMKTRRKGVIVNDIGNGGEVFDFNYVAGSAGNASLMAFTRAMGGVSLDHGVRVVGINPGPVATERLVKMLRRKAADTLGDAGRWEELIAGFPGGRVATPEEVADLMVFLASPRCGYITGTIVTIDGGIASRRSVN